MIGARFDMGSALSFLIGANFYFCLNNRYGWSLWFETQGAAVVRFHKARVLSVFFLSQEQSICRARQNTERIKDAGATATGGGR